MENPKKSALRLRMRVTAKKRGRDVSTSAGAGARKIQRECVNSVKKLQRREIGGFPRMARGASSNAPEKFRNIQLQVSFGNYWWLVLGSKVTIVVGYDWYWLIRAWLAG